MSNSMPTVLRASGRWGVRALTSGALAVGVLTAAPMTTDAHAATRHHRIIERKVDDATRVAVHQKGDPYQYGAAGPGRFDCSGLTYFSFRKAGFRHIPRTSSGQAQWARHVKKHKARRGDLIFFRNSGGVYHVGVFAGRHHGEKYVLHSPYSGAKVRREKIWTSHWFAGKVPH
ncbi:C40 family peptidase [Nocardioides taihuensis]|uniref:C40 family peptidase n=1 Tax=Nocardioides taihuensis TaxID=1835606 RepID=A0ABW0BJW4_9ACTN